MDPMVWANQQFGLHTCVANGGHMLRAIKQMKRDPIGFYDSVYNVVYDTDDYDCVNTQGCARLMGRTRVANCQLIVATRLLRTPAPTQSLRL